jgi:tRNA C32,U32 (ribose-2'-O)-methylase TrmJ
MGADGLFAISPECDLSESKARQGAAGAQEHLQNITLFDKVDDFVAHSEDGIRIAMSARTGKNRPSKPLPELLQEIKETHKEKDLSNTPIYIVLGPEDDGLATSDIEKCHYCAKLPTYGEFKSLNLGHAAQLSLYIVQDFLNQNYKNTDFYEENFKPVDLDSLPLVSKWLEALGFDLSSPKVNAALNLSTMLNKCLPTQKEKDLFDKVLNQTLRKLKEKTDG